MSGAVVSQEDPRDVLTCAKGSWERSGECDELPGGKG